MIEAIVTIADNPQTAAIPEGATVQLNGSQGQADCKVFLRVVSSGVGPAGRIYLHVRSQTAPWYTLEGVTTLQWFGQQIVKTAVLGVERLPGSQGGG